jgi:hypothetical protein
MNYHEVENVPCKLIMGIFLRGLVRENTTLLEQVLENRIIWGRRPVFPAEVV